MPRPRCCRNIAGTPACRAFKPAGAPTMGLGDVTLSLDEYEAIRLADHEGLYQEDAALRMGVSRQTFGRTIAAARRKVAGALVEGLVLRIELSPAEAAAQPQQRDFLCRPCGKAWKEPFGTGMPPACPACGSDNFRRADCGCGPNNAKP